MPLYAAIVVPTSTGDTLTANVGTQLADTGTLTLIVLAVGIPLFFYVAKKVIALFPKK